MRHAGAAAALILAAALAASAGDASAQVRPSRGGQADIEAAAARNGVPVPAAFYRRIAADPDAFTLPNGLFRTEADGTVRVQAVEGTRRVAVIPALFADSPEPHVTRQTIQERLFDGPAPRGTLTAAYLEISGGRLRVTGQVSDWIRTGLTLTEVAGESSGLGDDAKVGEFLLQALAGADPTIDFGLYDNDGPDGIPNSGDDNGYVDAMAFEFIEVAGSCGGPGIWPHLWGIAPQNDGEPYATDDVRPDGSFVKVDAYIIQSAVDCGGEEPQDAAVIAHEFGHVLGLPDYYHPVDPANGSFGRRWVLGCWELMAAGAWGCGEHATTREPFGPTHFSARSKNLLNWVRYRDVGPVRNETLVLRPVQESEEALRIPLDTIGREFLIVEYRTRQGFDRDLPSDGVLIYHMDLAGRFRPNTDVDERYFLALLEQDDNAGLRRTAVRGGNRGEAGDAWGVEGDRKLNSETAPNSRRNDGTPSTVSIHSLVVRDGAAHIRLSTSPTPAIMPPSAPWDVGQVTHFERRLQVAGGALPYTPVADLPEGVFASGQGDELVVAGSVTGSGPFDLTLQVRDARGTLSDALVVPLTAGEWTVSQERLVGALFGTTTEPLTRAEELYLDFLGNGNGRFDVGDLRAWLRR
ncbi:MAG: M6 family metalloprotease domain-containing protein [Longimicrobiales bacterium]